MPEDPFDLKRFVAAQDAGGTYSRALAELRSGRKRGHWMWFVFPQSEGLGSSDMARRYAIRSPGEAIAYLDHPVLGPRLVECARALLGLTERDAGRVMGEIDAIKLRSSMTLFAATAGIAGTGRDAPFGAVLDQYFGGAVDPATVAWLASSGG